MQWFASLSLMGLAVAIFASMPLALLKSDRPRAFDRCRPEAAR